MIKAIAIIPARYASTRFPGKPLVMINGKSMIMRVYEQALKAKSLKDVYVATDDVRIFDHVTENGGKVLMTSADHSSGTERCYETFGILLDQKRCSENEIIVNVQGDEPFISPQQIEEITQLFDNEDTEIATLKKQINNEADIADPNCVKIVCDIHGQALYFSRSPIPYIRDAGEQMLKPGLFFRHIGLYAYRSDILRSICQLRPSSLEMAEKLEQLRWLENGYKIRVGTSDYENISIDTPDDLLKVTNIT
ncbi:MAG: 3-deoxy-manno-octulosonate cytidylyltransferase [Bacteroidales bacterium]